MSGPKVPYTMIKTSDGKTGSSADPAGTQYEADGNFGLQIATGGTSTGILDDPTIVDASVDGLFGSVGGASVAESIDSEPASNRTVGLEDESIAQTKGTYYDPLAVGLLDELFPA